tara:strand:- start:230 stop:415 length:186 start_codon:yes stop_codon:yes gene_type:complete
LKQLNATDFNTISDMFVDGYQSFIISDEQYLFVTKDAVKFYHKLGYKDDAVVSLGKRLIHD